MLEIAFSDHAVFEMGRRAITKEVVIDVVTNPAITIPSTQGRVVLQGKYTDPVLAKEMVLRVIGAKEREVFKVITVYKTSKFDKYWSEGDESNI